MITKLKKQFSNNYVKITFVGLIFVFILLFITNGVPFIYSDGYASFHTSSAIVEEGSFVFKDRPEHLDYRGHTIAYYNDHYTVVYAPGSAIINTPAMAIAQLFESDETTIYNDYYKATNGHTLAEGTAFLVTATISGLLSIFLIYKALCAFGYSQKISLLATLISYFSSYAIWYVFLNPSFGHTYEILGVSLFLWGYANSQNIKPNSKNNINIYLLASGAGAGIAVLSRPILIVPAIIFGVYLLLKLNWRAIFIYLLGAFPFAVLLLSFNYNAYGVFIASGYDLIRGESFIWETFNGLNVLLSPYRGWLVYSPIFILGLLGLVYLWKKNKKLVILSVASIASIVILYGFWPMWWGGGSYGSRFLLPAMPFAAIGLAHILHIAWKNAFAKKILLIISFIFLSWSLSLTVLYRFTPIAEIIPKDNNDGLMLAGDRYTPLDIFDYHFKLISDSTSISDYGSKLIDSANGGNPYITILLGFSNITIRIDERIPEQLKFHTLYQKNFSQDAPESFNAILRDPKNNTFSKLAFAKPEPNKEYILNCTNSICISQTNNVTLSKLENPLKKLFINEYKGFFIKSQNLEIYFQNAENLFFKGDPINLPPDQNFYSFE